MVWYSHLLKNIPQLFVIHIVKGFSIVSEADVFLEFSCFFCDPVVVGNLISGSSAFSEPSLYIWKILIHVLLKPSLKEFEHNFTSMRDEHKCMVFEHSLTLSFFGIGIKTEFFQSCGYC